MDILPTNILSPIVISVKILIITIGCAIAILNYFHQKEAKKMEKKLRIGLPGSVSLAMTAQTGLSVIFLFIATILLVAF